MNLTKCKALRVLGFKYITRDMNGNVTAWKSRPVRSLSVTEGYEKQAMMDYPDAVITDIVRQKDKESNYADGYDVEFCWFSRAESDTADDSILHINKSDEDYKEVTWKNSPYVLGDSLNGSQEEKYKALKDLGFNYLTRDMDGGCLAWVIKPVRVVTILDSFVKEYADRFKDADLRIETEKDEDDEYVEGYHVYYCSYQCSKEDKGLFYNTYKLDTDDKAYENILWENEPYIL